MSSDGHLSRLHATYDIQKEQSCIAAALFLLHVHQSIMTRNSCWLFWAFSLSNCSGVFTFVGDFTAFFPPLHFCFAPSFLTLTPVPSSARPGIIKSENPNIQPPFPGSIVTLLVALNKCLCNIACSDQFRAAPWMLSQFAPVLLLTT